VKHGDLALVYYAGHGMEVKESNYLLPVDLPRGATRAMSKTRQCQQRGCCWTSAIKVRVARVLILDACSDNPLRASRSAAGGLAPMERRERELKAVEAGWAFHRTCAGVIGSLRGSAVGSE
jgi:uncharacterized caspase-like protein